MHTLSNQLKDVIAQHLKNASAHDVLTIASALCGETQPRPQVFARNLVPQLEIVDDDIAIEHVTGLTWLRAFVPGGRRNWRDSMAAASKIDVRGWKWRAPTARELLTLPDYEKEQPAINTIVFPGTGSDFVWSSTTRGDCAFGVDFYNGNAYWDHLNNDGFLRAVRVGQP